MQSKFILDDPINNTTILYYAHCASFPCPIRRGSTMTNTFSFIPGKSEFACIKMNFIWFFTLQNYEILYTGETHQRVRIIMYYNFMGVRVNYPGVHGADACDHIYSYPDKVKVGCPMEKGKRYIYEITERVRSDVPKVSHPFIVISQFTLG